MTTYIAMLRGINVSGKNIIKMTDCRKSMQDLGLDDVTTYIQSGNIIFKTPAIPITKLTKLIQQKIKDDFGISASVTVKTLANLKKTIDNNPFLKLNNHAPSTLHVTFLSESPTKINIEKLSKIQSQDEAWVRDDEIYLYCPNGYGRTKLTNNYFERTLLVSATTRNWKTISRLYELANTQKATRRQTD